jgi:demethylmenaquinone methyltransferase / 2-methoxy-6-polyprenyl-1,4-benzoquinol methylase
MTFRAPPSETASTIALAPHPTLRDYYASAQTKRRFVGEVFDRAAADYDRVENLMALGTGRWYRRQALLRAGLARGMRVLDVAVGTGLVAREEVDLVGGNRSLVFGLDPSMAMMRQATRALGITGIRGVGERLPLADASLDFVSMGYALRHVSDVRATFCEFHRVLRRGGRVCVLEIARPRAPFSRAMLRAYMRYVVPAFARLASTNGGSSRLLWQYYWDTIDACVPPEAVVACLRECGFSDVRAKRLLGVFCEYTGGK